MDNKSETTQTETRPLRRKEAAAYIQNTHGVPCSPNTLAKLASVGGGPAFRKASRFPLYSRSDLDAWVQGKMSALVRSTSELAASVSA